MARGTLFEVKTDPKGIGSMSEEDFYEDLEVLNVNYVADRSYDEQEYDRDWFIDTFRKYGATVQSYSPEDDAEEHFPNGTYTVSGIGLEFKEKWFQDKWQSLKKQVDDISLEEFSCNIWTAYDIRKLVDDSMTHAVYLDGGIYTLDRFIRGADEKSTYYLGTTVLMH